MKEGREAYSTDEPETRTNALQSKAAVAIHSQSRGFDPQYMDSGHLHGLGSEDRPKAGKERLRVFDAVQEPVARDHDLPMQGRITSAPPSWQINSNNGAAEAKAKVPSRPTGNVVEAPRGSKDGSKHHDMSFSPGAERVGIQNAFPSGALDTAVQISQDGDADERCSLPRDPSLDKLQAPLSGNAATAKKKTPEKLYGLGVTFKVRYQASEHLQFVYRSIIRICIPWITPRKWDKLECFPAEARLCSILRILCFILFFTFLWRNCRERSTINPGCFQKSDGNGGMVVKRVKSDGAAALTGTLQVCSSS
jgi:hypothetical protein